MTIWLSLSRWIDALNARIGASIRWLILAAVLISAGNAIIRKTLGMSSNAFLEVQWYLFAAVFLLGAGYTLLRNAHVRIDFLSSRLSQRAYVWVDIAGLALCVIPLCLLMIRLSWPVAHAAWLTGETSQNAGGLVRWPVYMLMPAAFVLLILQAVSELIKRVAFLRGLRSDPFSEDERAR